MKIRTQQREGNVVTLEIEEDHALFKQAQARAFARASQQMTIPGFRQGKAPRQMVEQQLNAEALAQQGAQDLIAETYPQVLAASKIEPVDYPGVEILELEEGKPLLYKLTVEVFPTVKVGKYQGLKLTKKGAAVSEEEVVQMLGRLKERLAVTNEQGEKQLLPLDDDFAKKVSSHGTLAEFKEEVRNNMIEEKKLQAEAALKDQVVQALVAITEVTLPKALGDREVEVMVGELRTSLAQAGLTLEQYLQGAKKEEAALRTEMRPAAEVRVKGKLALQAVAEKEKITISDDEVAAELKSLADSLRQTPAEVEKNSGEGTRAYIKDYLLRKKALDLIVAKANIEEEKQA